MSGSTPTAPTPSSSTLSLLRLIGDAGTLTKFPQHSASSVGYAIRCGWIELDAARSGWKLTDLGVKVARA